MLLLFSDRLCLSQRRPDQLGWPHDSFQQKILGSCKVFSTVPRRVMLRIETVLSTDAWSQAPAAQLAHALALPTQYTKT